VAGGADLDDAVLQEPLTVTFVPPEDAWPQVRGRGPRPAIWGLAGVDASKLVLIDVYLGTCRLGGAHHLDQLRIEGPAAFAETPRGWHTWWWGWPPVWRWSRRQVLFEERQWRVATGRGAKQQGWYPELLDPHEVAKLDRQLGLLGPERIAVLYRWLRKGYEDAKNEPGAADFYYGEMEMRRHARSTPAAERLLIGLYWLIAGYGLRASRALAALLLIVAGFAVLFQQFGFSGRQQPGFLSSLLYAALTRILEEPSLTWHRQLRKRQSLCSQASGLPLRSKVGVISLYTNGR